MAQKNLAINIQFSKEDAQILDDFQKAAEREDKSEAVLHLTEKVIDINASSYHAWSYRWQCLEALGSQADFEAEKAFVQRLAEWNCKNYQLWNHRRCLAMKLGPEYAQEELQFAAECLEDDSKNYHTWAHRQAVVKQFKLWDIELHFTEYMLGQDVRNNSAWNQRIFLWREGPWSMDKARLHQELEFVRSAIRKAPHNESSWNYLQGFVSLSGGHKLLARSDQIHSICQECLQAAPSCSPALSMLANIYLSQKHVSKESSSGDKDILRILESLAEQCYQRLETTDPVRKAYWRFRSTNIAES